MPKEKLKEDNQEETNQTEEKDVPVSSVMSRNYLVYPPSTQLSIIAKEFLEKTPDCVLVAVGEDIAGIVTKKKLLESAKVKELGDIEKTVQAVKSLSANKFMEKPVPIFENQTTSDALAKMSNTDSNILIVLDIKKRLIGILSKKDIISNRTAVKVDHKSIDPHLETAIDKLLHIIQKVESIDLERLSKELNAKPELVEEWGSILEENGLIEVDYPAFGKPLFKIVKKEKKEE